MTSTTLGGIVASRYAIAREIGRGGMARVYLAHDNRHDRDVALKVLHPEVAATIGKERFLQEIRTAARLNHPHILPLHDSGTEDGALFYVMPYVAGPTLRDYMNETGRVPVADAVRIIRQIALALDYAHRLGVVHRDVKPENVMLHEGEALVMDFGIAKAVETAGNSMLTGTGFALGTPAYMSPEQASGAPDVDARADQYSLACVLYEMLSGRPPFTGPTAQAVMAKRFVETPEQLATLAPDVPAGVARALARAMARDPGERFPSAADFACALTEAVHDSSESAQADGKRSIAVLPFANLSNETGSEFFSEGISDEIINALTKVESLNVASRTSAFAYRGSRDDIREIGRTLGVGTVLEGSVRRAGNRLRITAQLVDVGTGYQLWSERYDREMADVFAIQDEIAENIVKALRLIITRREQAALRAPRARNVRAYEYYLRGRRLIHLWGRGPLREAEDMFRRAIGFDPDYTAAHAGLADAAAFRYMYFDGGEEALQQTDVASRRAFELEPQLAEARAARGLALLCQKAYEESEAEFKVAMELDPTLFEAPYFYGRMLWQAGRLEEAAAFLELASSLRADDYQAAALAASVYRALKRPEQGHGMARRAAAAAARAIAANPTDVRAYTLGANAMFDLGEGERAHEWCDRALELAPDDSSVLYNVACIHAMSGRIDMALDCLERLGDIGSTSAGWMRNDPDLGALRGHPRMEALIARLENRDGNTS